MLSRERPASFSTLRSGWLVELKLTLLDFLRFDLGDTLGEVIRYLIVEKVKHVDSRVNRSETDRVRWAM